MKKLFIIVCLVLTGCGGTFPLVPDEMLKECGDLKTLPADVKMSALTETVVENYTQYHQCSNRNQTWIEWYNKQKHIAETK